MHYIPLHPQIKLFLAEAFDPLSFLGRPRSLRLLPRPTQKRLGSRHGSRARQVKSWSQPILARKPLFITGLYSHIPL